MHATRGRFLVHTYRVKMVRVITRNPQHLLGYRYSLLEEKQQQQQQQKTHAQLFNKSNHETTCTCNNIFERPRKQQMVDDLVTVCSVSRCFFRKL